MSNNKKRKANNDNEDEVSLADEKCSFGKHLQEDCHKNFKYEIIPLQIFAEKDQSLFNWRSGYKHNDTTAPTICNYHKYKFGDGFQKQFTKCSNIFEKHTKKVKGGHLVSLELATDLKNKGKHVIPGWQLCRSCYETAKQVEDDSSTTDENKTDDEIIELEKGREKKAEKEKLDMSLGSLGISPLKSHGLPKITKTKLARTELQQSFEKQKDIVATVFDVSKDELNSDVPTQNEKDILQKAKDLDRLLYLMKEKLNDKTLKTSQKIKILTLSPESWSRSKVASFFNVSEYIVREARKVKESKGILELPDVKKGRKLSEEVKQDVLLFYEDDEYSRLMPGTKDYVSLGKKVHKQKRLLLCNLNELYTAFKNKYPNSKIGLSKFCSLRPKWCVTVSASGTHSVCVCTSHQNTKLIVDAFTSTINKCIKKFNEHDEEDDSNIEMLQNIDIDYKQLMQIIVCDINSMECMVHRCEKCPSFGNLQKYLEEKFSSFEFDDDITYSQWDSTDRTELRNYTSSVDDFIELLVYQVDSLTTHSYVAKSQARYLKGRKSDIDQTSCIVLLDFAENYHFVVQDEVQGYHWNYQHCGYTFYMVCSKTFF